METMDIVISLGTVVLALTCSWFIFSPLFLPEAKKNKSIADEQL